MTWNLILALGIFCTVATITPGPNNLMVMTSGANYGFRRTMPHMLGIAFGFTFMVLLVGAGLIQVFDAFPVTHQILTVLCVGYLLWLAWKITNATAPTDGAAENGKPFTFFQAAMFQWVNPKGWSMALSAITIYASDRSLLAIALVAGMFGLVALPCISLWTVLGQQMRRILTNQARLRVFNYSMAALLVASLIPVLYH